MGFLWLVCDFTFYLRTERFEVWALTAGKLIFSPVGLLFFFTERLFICFVEVCWQKKGDNQIAIYV